jgi:endonuclease YncB( thermonuclease family)
MLRCVFSLLLFSILLTAGCQSGSVSGIMYRGEISRVHDGDSIHLKLRGGDRIVVRLSAIDAPELEQRAGVASRDHLRALSLHRDAQAHCHKKDQYDRQLCTVFVGDINVNLRMVESGFAWHYKRFQHEQHRDQRRLYAAAEDAARRDRLGLWAAAAVAPWDFRAR